MPVQQSRQQAQRAYYPNIYCAFLHFLLLLHTVLNRSIFVRAYLRSKSNKMYLNSGILVLINLIYFMIALFVPRLCLSENMSKKQQYCQYGHMTGKKIYFEK